ncbi:MAG TPA: hypothetical protein VMA74_03295 [Dyella sp.]|uniref:hypothetical protein n=1 Tax=Dyella sp. TaxID=1869338 RepID=UPI002C295E29|nr:hypothetical protein [Dyella sp.]HUB88733.1 hypothetical protein [Dyella sp.]
MKRLRAAASSTHAARTGTLFFAWVRSGRLDRMIPLACEYGGIRHHRRQRVAHVVDTSQPAETSAGKVHLITVGLAREATRAATGNLRRLP